MKLHFLGATGTVTGSKYLLDHAGRQVLVDCGLFQGLKNLRLRNWDALPLRPSLIDAVVLTHAHIDHSGYVPRLVKMGFRGHVYCSAATRDLCELLLPDSGRLQEEAADFANRHGHSKHHPALPLYTQQEALEALTRFKTLPFDEDVTLWPGWQLRLRHAGHMLGAASVRVSCGGRSVLFSGDLGRSDDLLMRPPAAADLSAITTSPTGLRRAATASSDRALDCLSILSPPVTRCTIKTMPRIGTRNASTTIVMS